MTDRLDLSASICFALGEYSAAMDRALAALSEARAAERIWARDGALWSAESQTIAEIEDRLGWLDLPANLATLRPPLDRFAQTARAAGLTQALLLGMGGSSLAPEVLRHILGVRAGYLDLRILDTTDPIEIRHAVDEADLRQTLVIVSSKSGTTAETRAQFLYLKTRMRDQVGESWQRHFVVITDPGSALAQQAQDEGLRLMYGLPNVGGRFSALSVFGMLPAALLGVDLARLGASAHRMAQTTRPGQLGDAGAALRLGAAMGALARPDVAGRNKLTLIASPRLSAFGAWAEQLVAESTGKQGTGIVPIDGEACAAADSYGADRLFVYVRLDGDSNAPTDAFARALVAAGQPLIYLRLRNIYALGAEFFRWEYATAVAGLVLGVNPFDQPDVEAAKLQARKALARYQEERLLEEPQPTLQDDAISVVGPRALPSETVDAYLLRVVSSAGAQNGYVALMAYVERSAEQQRALQVLRGALAKRLGLATTLGFGPRFLHSTGQLHKGGPSGGLFVQITRQDEADLAIPGESYSFGVLKRAQALGDLAALRAAERQVLRIDLLQPNAGAQLVALARLAHLFAPRELCPPGED